MTTLLVQLLLHDDLSLIRRLDAIDLMPSTGCHRPRRIIPANQGKDTDFRARHKMMISSCLDIEDSKSVAVPTDPAARGFVKILSLTDAN